MYWCIGLLYIFEFFYEEWLNVIGKFLIVSDKNYWIIYWMEVYSDFGDVV